MGEVLVFLRIKHDANFALFLHAKRQRQEKTFLPFKYHHSKSVLECVYWFTGLYKSIYLLV